MSGIDDHGRETALRRSSAALALIFGFGCGPSDGVVGVTATPAAPRTPTFEAQYEGNDGLWQADTPLPGAEATVGAPRPDASDGHVATILLPGHPEYGPMESVGPEWATALSSTPEFGFGTYRFRVAFGGCAATEEAAAAVLAYFNDGSDRNGNALTDDVEIDFQVLCGSPARAYLNVFTDYESGPGGERFRKLTRIVGFAEGTIHDTPSESEDTFAEGARNPELRLPGLLADGQFYELGFDWRADSLRFFIMVEGSERTLWHLTDPARVPRPPVQIIYNVWHPDTHWFPLTGGADYPARDVRLEVDWFRYYAAD